MRSVGVPDIDALSSKKRSTICTITPFGPLLCSVNSTRAYSLRAGEFDYSLDFRCRLDSWQDPQALRGLD